MANGQKGKASKRKLDMREESGKLARQIGDRIRELREKMKDGDGRPITQPAFYDFIFDKPEYQQSTDNPNEPKPEESKQTEISNIEGGKDISLALLCLISDKCGVSLDYLIRGKEYQPGESTCPPEEKDASPAGGDVVESQTEKNISAEMTVTGSQYEYLDCMKSTKAPYNDYLSLSVQDVCKSLAALSFITDMVIHGEYMQTGGRLEPGILISIFPKEEVYEVSAKKEEDGYYYDYKFYDESSTPKEDLLAFHLYDTRGKECIEFLRRLWHIQKYDDDDDYITKNMNNIFSTFLRYDSTPLCYAFHNGMYVTDFLRMGDDDIYNDDFRMDIEPYHTFLEREKQNE